MTRQSWRRVDRLVFLQDITRAVLYALSRVLYCAAVETEVSTVLILLSAASVATSQQLRPLLTVVSESEAARCCCASLRLLDEALSVLLDFVRIRAVCGGAEVCVISVLFRAFATVLRRLLYFVHTLLNAMLDPLSAGAKV